MKNRYSLALIALLLFITACQDNTSPKAEESATEEQNQHAEASATPEIDEAANSATLAETPEKERKPPKPPILEDFQGDPKLSLFPRVGDHQPPPDSERHPYWRTFIDHLVKVTGVAENAADSSRGWVFRSINTIDSLGYFSPIAVTPNRSYQVSFKLIGELPEGASAGIGILEFDQFLWIGEQYTEETFQKHYRGVHEGRRVTGKPAGLQTFTFTTGPETRMIHLVLFREGTHDRNSIMFDNISIK